jgi:hypothetical protein
LYKIILKLTAIAGLGVFWNDGACFKHAKLPTTVGQINMPPSKSDNIEKYAAEDVLCCDAFMFIIANKKLTPSGFMKDFQIFKICLMQWLAWVRLLKPTSLPFKIMKVDREFPLTNLSHCLSESL